MTGLYRWTKGAVKCEGGVFGFFLVNSEVKQGHFHAPLLLNTWTNWVLGKVFDQSRCGESACNIRVTDIDFAGDAVLLTKYQSPGESFQIPDVGRDATETKGFLN